MINKSDQILTWIIEVSVSIYLYVLLSLTEFMEKHRDKCIYDIGESTDMKITIMEYAP